MYRISTGAHITRIIAILSRVFYMSRAKTTNTLRIIGGQWRGRKLQFPDVEGLRPTTDRVRETLFNWLAPVIHGAHCLDLFSGSGALGLEALSRGAAHAVLLDRNAQAIRALRQHAQTLHCTTLSVHQTNALDYLRQPASETFSVVFLDPPFHQDLITPCAELLESQGWLDAQTRIYIESEPCPHRLPANWELLRDKRAGQVQYQLWLRHDKQTNEETS